MIDHDKLVGAVLDKLDELGIADDTIVVYSTDNGPHMNTWPDGGMTPFRSEKNTNWEGAFRVPEMIRWPGRIPAGVVSNEIVQHHDWLPTFLAAAGEPDVVEKLKAGHTIGDTTFKVHIDGYNLLPYLTGEAASSPRKGFVYFSDDGDLLALRFDNWKVVFMEQRVAGTLQLWAEPFVALRVPKLFNLRTDPFERADVTSNTYYDWFIDNCYIVARGDRGGHSVPRDVQGVPAAPEGRELHDRPGGREARGGADGGALTWPTCPPGTTRRPGRRSSSSSSRSRATCRWRSASRSSTTTARCGARSRCSPRSASCSSASRRWPRRTRRCGSASRGRRPTRAISPGWAERSPSTTGATTPT